MFQLPVPDISFYPVGLLSIELYVKLFYKIVEEGD